MAKTTGFADKLRQALLALPLRPIGHRGRYGTLRQFTLGLGHGHSLLGGGRFYFAQVTALVGVRSNRLGRYDPKTIHWEGITTILFMTAKAFCFRFLPSPGVLVNSRLMA